MAAALAAALFSLAGCGAPGGAGDAAPGTRADIRGYVAGAWGVSADPRPGEVVGSVLIEGELEEDTRFDRASVTVTDATRIYRREGDGFTAAAFADLEAGQLVQAVFTGPVAESYPVQATAEEIVILSSTEAGKVLDRHASELFAIAGVVGAGISSREGRPVIVVYLESDDPEFAAAVPAELEGFRVVTEVTGPVEAQPL